VTLTYQRRRAAPGGYCDVHDVRGTVFATIPLQVG
jgi:hypothetical protein